MLRFALPEHVAEMREKLRVGLPRHVLGIHVHQECPSKRAYHDVKQRASSDMLACLKLRCASEPVCSEKTLASTCFVAQKDCLVASTHEAAWPFGLSAVAEYESLWPARQGRCCFLQGPALHNINSRASGPGWAFKLHVPASRPHSGFNRNACDPPCNEPGS